MSLRLVKALSATTARNPRDFAALRIAFLPRFQISEGGENVLLLAVTERSPASAAPSMGAKVEQEDLISPAREGYCELGKIRFVRADPVADDDGRRRRVW